MTTDCQPFIADDLVFPRRPTNRPGLPRIQYRIGVYPEFVAVLNRAINSSVELRAWTHRGADDPGIALLEGAAVLGDILSFYQERYANEAFLRTAGWRESVASLTRLLGYRLAPGVGGRATLAFEVRGSGAIEIPERLPIKADLQDVPDPVDLQTVAPLTAYPHLSRFHLYRQRLYGSFLAAGATHFEVKSVGGSIAAASLTSLELKKGDRLFLAPPEPAWTTSGSGAPTAQQSAQVVKVKSVAHTLGRTIVELEAAVAEAWLQPVTAYRIGRGFRHFGHSAPPKLIQNTTGSDGKINGATERATWYARHVRANHSCSNTDSSINLPGELLPLDQQVDDLHVGSRVVIETLVQTGGSPRSLAVVKVVRKTRAATVGFGSQNGPCTLLTLDSGLTQAGDLSLSSDVRDYHISEVTSAAIQLQPLATFSSVTSASGPAQLYFFGTLAEVKALAGRRVLLQLPAGETAELHVTSTESSFTLPSGVPDEPRMWPVWFDKWPTPAVLVDFDERTPTIDVFGNVIDALQGKAEAQADLGNGDARASFQTFKLPKAPLTYHLAAGATPPEVPQLQIYVQGQLWDEVDSLFGQAGDAHVYIVREDGDGASYVQFGDGLTGARLPSGVNNVVAQYRTGNGARGPIKKRATPSAGRRIDGVDKLHLLGLVTGGSGPEVADKARESAPGKIQSLGRLVSLRDFETETRTIPGVTSVTAEWGMHDGVPAVLLRVLLEAGREGEFDAVRGTLQKYQRCRGPDRFAVHVEQAWIRYVFVDLTYAFDPRLMQTGVEAAIRTALGVDGDGLFTLERRRLGGKEYATRIEGVVQEVRGVTWAKVTGLGMFASHATAPTLPSAPRPLNTQLTPDSGEVLRLLPAHCTLVAAPSPPALECA